jgi:hypothetical protein
MGSDVGDDLAHRLAIFEALPDHHRRLVQLIIFFRVEIYENTLAAFEVRGDNVFAWH